MLTGIEENPDCRTWNNKYKLLFKLFKKEIIQGAVVVEQSRVLVTHGANPRFESRSWQL